MSPYDALGTAMARITDLEAELARLREATARHRDVFASIDESVCIIEMLFDAAGEPVDYRFLDVNAAFERQTGLKDVVGKRMREIEPRTEEHWFRTFGRVAERGIAERFVNEARWLSGRWFAVYAFPIGRPEERTVAVLFGDTSAHRRAEESQRESEQRWRALSATLEERVAERTQQLHALTESLETERRRLEAVLDSLPVGVWIADLEGNLAGKNALGDRIWYGDPPSGQRVNVRAGYDAWDAQDGHKLASDEYPVVIALRTGRPVAPLELRVPRVDGGAGTILVSAAPIRDAQGALVGAVGVGLDITERVLAEQALQRAHTRLRALSTQLAVAEERERRRLAELLHDDLQQTLAAVMFHLDMVREQAPSALAELLRYPMEMLHEAIDSARSLSAELSPNLLRDTGLQPAFQALALHMERKHGLRVTLVADEPADASPVPEDIRLLLYRSVRELLFNTVKHAGVKTASVRVDRSERHVVRVIVSDEGRGFAPDQIGDGPSGGGLGLLSISERLAYFGGSVDVDSSPGRGTRITLRVAVNPGEGSDGPRSGESPDDSADGRAALSAAPQESTAEGRIRILLADDHAIVRQGLRRFLDEQPDLVVVGEAEDGQQAIDMARALHPDVVLMDLSMPRMNGIDATYRIAAELPGTRIIGLSMFDDPEKRDLMRRAGAHAYVTKGGPPSALLAAVRDAVK